MSDLPVESWSNVITYLNSHWKHGEHMLIIGATGTGKTYALTDMVINRPYTIVVCTKGTDETLVKRLLSKRHWVRFRSITDFERRKRWQRNIVFWPDIPTLEHVDDLIPQLAALLNYCYTDKHWTIVIDDAEHVSERLQQRQRLQDMLQISRAEGVTMVIISQRPAWLPVAVYDNVTYSLCYLEADEKLDTPRFSQLARISVDRWKKLVSDAKPRSAVFTLRRKKLSVLTTVS